MKLIERTKESTKQIFKMKNLGELRFFLSIEFARSKAGLVMHQRKYALELISETGLSRAKSAGTPIDVHIKLTSKQYNEQTGQNQDDKPVD